jgi:hypothetical protein
MQEKNLSKGNILALLKTNKNDDNWEVIESYVVAGGEGIVLTDLQQKMYERWVFIDEKLRQSKFRRYEIYNMVHVRFGVSVETARRDMVGAEMVFSSTTPLNKKYFIGARISKLEHWINIAAAMNDFEKVAKLEAILQKYIDIYPDTAQNRSPKKIVMHLTQNIIQGEVIDTKEAELIIDEELKNGNYESDSE